MESISVILLSIPIDFKSTQSSFNLVIKVSKKASELSMDTFIFKKLPHFRFQFALLIPRRF